jgi:hypothetical protein
MNISRSSASAGLLVAFFGIALQAHATVYKTNEELLGEFFRCAKDRPCVTYRSISLDDATAAEIGKKLGVALPKKTWNVYLDEYAGHTRTGYALLDQEIGLHDLILYGVRLSLGGAVERVDIREYREAYGDEVRSERFLKQFVGKTASDPIVAGRDIDIVSSATYSSKSVALGVKRDVLVLHAALKNGL